jgi:hypothetical protein
MLVPHIQHDTPTFMCAKENDDLDSFFEFVDEVVFSHTDQTPDNQESDGQFLDEVANEEYCNSHNLVSSFPLKLYSTFSTFKKTCNDVYKERISLDIVAPPPDFI